jgi:hypothetical protein
LIVGGNVEALVANHILVDLGYDPKIVVGAANTQNSFVFGPWRPVGASPVLASVLDDLGIEYAEHNCNIGAAGVEGEGSEILDVETAIERELQTVKFDRFPEFRAAVAGRPARELTFDRAAFYRELSMTASLDTEALRIDSVRLDPCGSVMTRTEGLALGRYGFWYPDLVIVTAPPRVWDPGHEVLDFSVTEVLRAPSELLPFDLIELGGASGFETVTWRNGNAMVETSGRGLPDLDELPRMLGVDKAIGFDAETSSFEVGGTRYRIGTTSRVRREVGDVSKLPSNTLALGRAATGEPQTLSQVAEQIADLIGK